MRYAIAILKRGALFALAWLALTGAAAEGLIAGAVTVCAATAISLRLMPPGPRPLRVFIILALAPGFVLRSILGGADVAWRALHPRLPITPGWISFPVHLEDGPARVAFGAATSLLPGTLPAGCRDGVMAVHCLDTNSNAARHLRAGETRIGRALSQTPTPAEEPRDG